MYMYIELWTYNLVHAMQTKIHRPVQSFVDLKWPTRWLVRVDIHKAIMYTMTLCSSRSVIPLSPFILAPFIRAFRKVVILIYSSPRNGIYTDMMVSNTARDETIYIVHVHVC